MHSTWAKRGPNPAHPKAGIRLSQSQSIEPPSIKIPRQRRLHHKPLLASPPPKSVAITTTNTQGQARSKEISEKRKQRSSFRGPVRPIFISSLTLSLSPRHSDHPIHLPPTLGHRTAHLPRQHILEIGKRLPFPLEILIPALHQLHKLARVDVRVARRVDVLDYLGWKLDAGEWGVGWVGGVGGGSFCGVWGESGVCGEC